MKMTFEELLVLIDKMNGEAGNATGGNVDSLVYSGLDVHLILEEIKSGIEQLQETYAPKIKMPQKIMLVFMEMKFNYQVDFEFFWKLMGDCVATDYLRENYKEEEIMMAWLHPELIEVSDD